MKRAIEMSINLFSQSEKESFVLTELETLHTAADTQEAGPSSAVEASSAIQGPRPKKRPSKRSSVLVVPSAEASELENQGVTLEATDLRVVYGDFTTIDWMRDWRRDHRRRFRFLQKKHALSSIIFEHSQSWLVIFLTGISIGLLAGCIDVVSAWLTDIRIGYCTNQWYAGRKICCKNVQDTRTLSCSLVQSGIVLNGLTGAFFFWDLEEYFSSIGSFMSPYQ